MTIQNIENRLRELLLPVFGIGTIEDLQPTQSLVQDLGAESLDFVEIMYVIERNFGVVLKTREIMLGGAAVPEDAMFADGVLTEAGAALLKQQFPEHTAEITNGLSKIAIYSMITVRDLAAIIAARLAAKSGGSHVTG